MNNHVVNSLPDSLVIDTTYLCNLTCKMCHQNAPDFVMPQKPHIPMDFIKKLLPIAKEASKIYLLGYGEPFMHPNMFEIIKLLKDNCPKSEIGTTSNGVLFNKKNIKKLIDSRLDVLSISIDGPNLERGHQKSEKTYANLININEAKLKLNITYPQVHIGFILGKDNENELLPVIEFANSVGAEAVTVDALRIIHHQEEWDDYIIDNDPKKHLNTILPILKEANKLANSFNMKINMPYLSEFENAI